MNAVAQVAPASIKPNQVLVAGRVDAVREWDGKDSTGYVTRVRLPAADEYSSSAVIEVSSRRKIGKAGDEVKILCTLSGWLKRGISASTKEAYELVNMRLVAAE